MPDKEPLFQEFNKKVNQLVGDKFSLVRFNFPTELEFEPIQVCNAKCFSCPYTNLSNLPDYTKQRMSRDNIQKLLTSFHDLLVKNNYTGPTTINPYRYSDPLVCPDLDFILDFATEKGLKVQITTNAKGMNSRTIPILERNVNALKDKIFISVLGSTEEEVQKNMKISLEYTLKKMRELTAANSPIVKKIMISLRVIDGTPEERTRLENLKKEFETIGVDAQIRSGWLHNRIEGTESEQTPDHYVVGCKLYRNKVLRRMEVMVNGNVVLCDDDAEGRRVFGNVFEQSIEEVWNGKLKEEHQKIFSRQFSKDKSGLLCSNCSRASYGRRDYSIIDTIKEVGFSNYREQVKKKNLTYMG